MSVPPSLALPAGVSSDRIGPRDTPLAVLRAGEGGARRPVVLVPGFTGSKEDFLPLLPLLASAGHPVLALDLPGQHESPGPDDPSAYQAQTLGAVVTAAAAEVSGGSLVHLLGHSFGGLVCRRAVVESNAPTASLTLLGSGPAGIDGQRAALLRLLRPVLDSGGVPAVWEASSAIAAQDPRTAALPDEVRDFLRRRFLASPAAALRGMGDALLEEPDLVDDLARAGLPVLVLHGEGDDAWPPAVQRQMAERLGAGYVVVPGALHSPAAEAPGPTAAALLEFWATVDARA